MAQELLARFPHAKTPEDNVDVEAIAEEVGITIRYFSLDDTLSGFLLTEGDQVLIGVNERDGERRQRFTIAHELGHFFLHDRAEAFMDRKTGHFQVTPRNMVSTQGTDVREIEANLFAAEILMPEDRVRSEVELRGGFGILEEDDAEIKSIADSLDVSVRALTIRLERLGYLTEA